MCCATITRQPHARPPANRSYVACTHSTSACMQSRKEHNPAHSCQLPIITCRWQPSMPTKTSSLCKKSSTLYLRLIGLQRFRAELRDVSLACGAQVVVQPPVRQPSGLLPRQVVTAPRAEVCLKIYDTGCSILSHTFQQPFTTDKDHQCAQLFCAQALGTRPGPLCCSGEHNMETCCHQLKASTRP